MCRDEPVRFRAVIPIYRALPLLDLQSLCGASGRTLGTVYYLREAAPSGDRGASGVAGGKLLAARH
jgi:hypothetical protein